MAELGELQFSVAELSSIGGGMRLRDEDILVVKTARDVTQAQLDAIRVVYEAELRRLGVSEPKVMAVPSEISLEVIERS